MRRAPKVFEAIARRYVAAQVDAGDHDSVRVEAEHHVGHVEQAADEQPRADEEQHRQRPLGDDQCRAQT
jgi:hypothetical protein